MPSVPVRRTAAALAAAVALTVSSTAPAAAAPWRVDYVNLGDSYSAAVGTGGLGPTALGPDCLQGDGRDHVSALDGRPHVLLRVDAACSGATTVDVRTTADLPRVRAALAKAELVTLTLGGNDVGWTEYLSACSVQGEAVRPGACDVLRGQAQSRIKTAATSAGETLAALGTATDGRVVVLGYPRLLEAQRSTSFVSAARAEQLNLLTDDLNAALAEAAEENGATFVDVSSRFAGHGVGAAEPWIRFDPAEPSDPENLHPTEEGYLHGYYAALEDAVPLGRLGC